MPGFLLHVGAVVQCTHMAPANTPPTQPRVLVSGQPVATTANQYLITGCPFFIALKPSPCIRIQWTAPATRVLINGLPALMTPAPGPAPGLCLSPEQAPQGPPMVTAVQARVLGI
jgi:hypothetical protein